MMMTAAATAVAAVGRDVSICCSALNMTCVCTCTNSGQMRGERVVDSIELNNTTTHNSQKVDIFIMRI